VKGEAPCFRVLSFAADTAAGDAAACMLLRSACPTALPQCSIQRLIVRSQASNRARLRAAIAAVVLRHVARRCVLQR
jgi:hypothetical protein